MVIVDLHGGHTTVAKTRTALGRDVALKVLPESAIAPRSSRAV
jgi:hypothetical protein